jgi:hypothetical protein
MYVLLGELKGDCDDYYERPVEVVACSHREGKLAEYIDELEADEDCEYVEFRIEEGVLL